MFRLWGKTFLHNRMTNDLVVCNDSEESEQPKYFRLLQKFARPLTFPNPSGLI